MTSTNHASTIESKMVKLNHFVDGNAMSEGFNVEIEHPISVSEAVKITGVKGSTIRYLCRQYQQTQGSKGLKSAKWGRDWQIEKQAAEDYERTNRGYS